VRAPHAATETYVNVNVPVNVHDGSLTRSDP
jgi:hypothetical protein